MKKIDLFFSVLSVPLDLLFLVLAAMAAYTIRFTDYFREWRPIIFDLPFSRYMDIVFPIVLFWLFIFALFGLYSETKQRPFIYEFVKIIAACSTGLTFIVFLVFFSRELFSSRFIVLAAWILSILFVTVERGGMRLIKRFLWEKGIGRTPVLLFGEDSTTFQLKKCIEKESQIGYKLAAHFKKLDQSNLKQIEKAIERKKIQELWVGDVSLSKQNELLKLANQKHLIFKYAADLFETQAANIATDTYWGIPFVEIKRTPLEGWGRVWKRIYDLVVCVLAMFFLSPVFLILFVLIKIDSKGPSLYKNERVGSRGKIFNTYKFRSMKLEYCTGKAYDRTGKALEMEKRLIEKRNMRQGPIYKIGDDPRRTRVGRFLEKTSLDELPQFLNVFLGNMSIVGPRPHQEREVAHYIDKYPQLFEIKPGITGLAQVSGRSNLTFEEEVKLDLYYIENWSFWKDLWISFKTPFVVLFHRHKS